MSTTPLWAVLPFPAYLVGLVLMPTLVGAFWESNRNKLVVALAASSPVLVYLMTAPRGAALLGRAACDYASFVALIAALFTISGGISISGALVGTPIVNTALLALGSVLGSLVGTTGASVLLIRPLLRANARRAYVTHLVVFFIFLVANAGGLLTPLGPPLFLGFLRGVPFCWTLRLAPQWLIVNVALLGIFYVVDRVHLARERRGPPGPQRALVGPVPPEARGPLRLDGLVNLVWLAGTVALVFFLGSSAERVGDGYLRTAIQIAGTLGFAALSFKTTARRVHEANRHAWGPLLEVAAIFVGVFITMVPAMTFLAERGPTLGITKPWQFFWASGALSSVLDNAPTYLTFASLATGVAGSVSGTALSPDDIGVLAAHPIGRELLAAISCGSVLMGAVTYVGNGPNFMVKAIAEQHGVRMPSFFGYVLWSGAILVPLFGVVSLVFF